MNSNDLDAAFGCVEPEFASTLSAVRIIFSGKLLPTPVARVAPLKTTTEEETNWLPVAVRTKLGGNCEKTMVVGEIELRVGAGRAPPEGIQRIASEQEQ